MENTVSLYLAGFLAVLAGYLSGSVIYAVLVTRAVTGQDIRTLGNKNPGTSNVARSIGKGWGVLVGFLDGFKVFGLLVLFRVFLFTGDSPWTFGVLYLIGIAGVVGHCLPVFFRFKGGGGIGTMQGVSLFFIPVEYLISMLMGGIIVLVFFKGVQHKYAQWTPIMFVAITPFLTIFTTLAMDLPLFAHISLGGHPWTVPAGALALSLIILALNIRFMRERGKELKEI